MNRYKAHYKTASNKKSRPLADHLRKAGVVGMHIAWDDDAYKELIGQLLAACVMYHHSSRLPDLIKPRGRRSGMSGLQNRKSVLRKWQQPAPAKLWRCSVMPWSIRKSGMAEYYLDSSQTWNVPIIMTLEEVLCLILLTR
jgi:hypothetical protein